ncbi:acyltransferase [Vibrio astriarenae]
MISKLLFQIRKITMNHTDFARKVGVNFGENCTFNTRDFGSEPYLITIGDNFYCSKNISFITHDGSVNVIRNSVEGYSDIDLFGRISIGNNVFIGVNSVVLPNTIVGDNVIIGAGSVIRGELQSNTVYAGVPVKKICSLDEWFEKNKNGFVNTKKLDYKSKREYIMDLI